MYTLKSFPTFILYSNLTVSCFFVCFGFFFFLPKSDNLAVVGGNFYFYITLMVIHVITSITYI